MTAQPNKVQKMLQDALESIRYPEELDELIKTNKSLCSSIFSDAEAPPEIRHYPWSHLTEDEGVRAIMLLYKVTDPRVAAELLRALTAQEREEENTYLLTKNWTEDTVAGVPFTVVTERYSKKP